MLIKLFLINEKQIGDPGTVTVLYERAIADIILNPVYGWMTQSTWKKI